MRETITIKLDKPLLTHEGPLAEIVLREPTFDEYLQFGDPYVVAGAQDGTPFGVENVDVIRQYLTVCLVAPKNPALLSQAGARTARQLKEALLSFFRPAAPTDAAPATSRTNSRSRRKRGSGKSAG